MTKKGTFFAVYFTFFIDNLSWAIVFPIFAPYFIDAHNELFSSAVATGTRTMLLGFFLTAFSLGQFLGAPVLGEYADKYGRRKALVVSVFFTLLGLGLSAWSMGAYSLYALFAGRLLTGVFASSTVVCLSCIADLSEDETKKAKRFGYLSTIAGVAFIVGAFLGGKLADRTINASFSPSIPLWIAGGLTFLNLLFVYFGFKETSLVHPSVKFHLGEAFHRIKVALKTDKIKRIYTVYFLFLLAWTILFQFFPVLTVEKFSFRSSNIGDLALFMGLCWAIGSGYLNKILVQRFQPKHILEVCLIGFAVLCGFVIFPSHIYGVLAILGFCVILGGLAWPLCTALISNQAPREMQGKILGVSQSVQSFAMTLGPLFGGLAFQFSLALPFLIAAAIGVFAIGVYFLFLRENS